MIRQIIALLSQLTKWAEMVRKSISQAKRQKRNDKINDDPGAAADDMFRMRREDNTDKADTGSDAPPIR